MTDQTPIDYADTLEAQMIVDYVASGMTVTRACKILGINRRQDIYRHMERSERFRDAMEKARLDGYDAIAEQTVEIADDDSQDIVETRFGPKFNKEFAARSKLRVETRLKLLAKWHPKKYGEKLQVDTTNKNVQIPISDDPIEAQKAYEDLMKG